MRDKESDRLRTARGCDRRRARPCVLVLVAVLWAAEGAKAALTPTRAGGDLRSLVWVAAGDHAIVQGEGCTGVLLDAQWVLVAARCAPSGGPVTLIAPRFSDESGGVDNNAAPAAGTEQPNGGQQWGQQRRAAEVLQHRNEATEAGAAPYPALALVRVDKPFALGGDGLLPAKVLWGLLDDDRRPLRCFIVGWDVMGDEGKTGAVYPSDITQSSIGRVLTYAQCASSEGLVERESQFCVEVPLPRAELQDVVAVAGASANASDEAALRGRRQGMLGNPLMCAGVLAGMRFLRNGMTHASTPERRQRVDVFTNTTYLEPWLLSNVPDIQVMTMDGGFVVPDTRIPETTPVATRRNHRGHFGRSSGQHKSAARSVLFISWVATIAAYAALLRL